MYYNTIGGFYVNNDRTYQIISLVVTAGLFNVETRLLFVSELLFCFFYYASFFYCELSRIERSYLLLVYNNRRHDPNVSGLVLPNTPPQSCGQVDWVENRWYNGLYRCFNSIRWMSSCDTEDLLSYGIVCPLINCFDFFW